jgi:glycosyltransferase involved in cell wall biosynthesis
MKILFATAHPYLPEMVGGLQWDMHELATRLTARGHSITLLTAMIGKGLFGFKQRVKLKLTGGHAVMDSQYGYPVYRAWFPWEQLAWVAKKAKPDAIVIMARQPVKMALAAQKTGKPILMCLQDVEFEDHGGDFKTLGKVPCVANSHFTAEKYRQAFDVQPTVIYPMIDAEHKYKTQSTRQYVTFINPQPVKGLDIAVIVAKLCPDIPFQFVEGWPLTDKQREDLMKKLALLPNVKLRPSTTNMKEIYGNTKILLAPSQWEEAFGRVAAEAQVSGIPVLASNRGGLPEAVGGGGLLVDYNGPFGAWVSALRRLWDDEPYYDMLSKEALRHATRTEMKLDAQTYQWEQMLHTLTGK